MKRRKTGGCDRLCEPHDWSKRDPSHCGAETQQLWELQLLMIHYHPFWSSNSRSL